MWACTELLFTRVIFYKCWWDVILFDALLCNDLGMVLCRIQEFHTSTTNYSIVAKIKRATLQFVPDWSRIHWFDPSSTYMHKLAIFVLMLIFQITELNTLLLNLIFKIPTHFNMARLLLLIPIGVSSVHQYYVYVTDNTLQPLGTLAGLYLSIMVTEALVSLRFGQVVKWLWPDLPFLWP